MGAMWTEATVRRDLPAVLVRIGKETVTARVYGRKLDFASVRLEGDDRGYEFAWSTIAHALNSGTPLCL